jgi:hypothetical protein
MSSFWAVILGSIEARRLAKTGGPQASEVVSGESDEDDDSSLRRRGGARTVDPTHLPSAVYDWWAGLLVPLQRCDFELQGAKNRFSVGQLHG